MPTQAVYHFTCPQTCMQAFLQNPMLSHLSLSSVPRGGSCFYLRVGARWWQCKNEIMPYKILRSQIFDQKEAKFLSILRSKISDKKEAKFLSILRSQISDQKALLHPKHSSATSFARLLQETELTVRGNTYEHNEVCCPAT